jgi:hypothetical protein
MRQKNAATRLDVAAHFYLTTHAMHVSIDATWTVLEVMRESYFEFIIILLF